MNYFESISQEKLSQLIAKTKESLFLSLPFLHQEMAEAIKQLSNKNRSDGKKIDIQILIDFDAQTIRQGYGELEPVRELINKNFNIKSMDDNRISFIISDELGYYLFMESRSLIPADKSTINAVKIDSVSIVRLKHYFFPSTNQEELKDELSDAIIEESQQLENAEQIMQKEKAPAKEITREKFENVTADIESNPPIRPDYERRVKIYANKFQYVEFRFIGQNFKSQTINIPPKAMPYRNKELRDKLITKLKVFKNIEDKDTYKPFREIEQKKKEIAEQYLNTIKCRNSRNVIKMKDKQAFVKAVNDLSSELHTVKKNMYKGMLEELKNAKAELQKTLKLFLIENPTDDMISIGKDNYSSMAENLSESIIGKINFPEPSQMIKNFKLQTYYSDITYEDLSDPELLNEFKEKGLIDEEDENNLADFSKGIKYSEGQSE